MTDAPERIFIDRGPNGGWMHRHKRLYDTRHEYTRTDLAKAQLRAAVLAEREACAKVADDSTMNSANDYLRGWREGALRIAAAIRARGDA